METIAVYWEERVRTYGFNLLEGLTLSRFSLPGGTPEPWDRLDGCPAPPTNAFRLFWAQVELNGDIRLNLVSEENNCHDRSSGLDKAVGQWATCERTAVDLVFFQGPHFGDRYGIIDFTFRALAAEVQLLGTVCATATIYLVFPCGQGRAATDMLRRAFEVPTAGKKIPNGGTTR
jgi:hypothetical protein